MGAELCVLRNFIYISFSLQKCGKFGAFMVAIIRKSWRKKLFDGVHKFSFLHLFAEVLDFLCPFAIIVPMTINVKIMMILGYTIINS